MDKQGHMSLRGIGATAGVSASTVLRDLRQRDDWAPGEDGTIRVGWTLGEDGKLRPDRRYDTSERDAEIVRLREDGQSIRQIARTVGCSVGTVHRVLNLT